MRLSAAGLDLLKKSEGFRDRIYSDVAGVVTIGYGHRLLPGESFPNGISEARALDLLQADIRRAEAAVERLVKVQLNQGQFDALVDFVFNLGGGRLAASTLLRELNAGRYDAAAGELQRWDHADGIEIASLKARRQAELQLWHDGRNQQKAVA
jgi:lysozyme